MIQRNFARFTCLLASLIAVAISVRNDGPGRFADCYISGEDDQMPEKVLDFASYFYGNLTAFVAPVNMLFPSREQYDSANQLQCAVVTPILRVNDQFGIEIFRLNPFDESGHAIRLVAPSDDIVVVGAPPMEDVLDQENHLWQIRPGKRISILAGLTHERSNRTYTSFNWVGFLVVAPRNVPDIELGVVFNQHNKVYWLKDIPDFTSSVYNYNPKYNDREPWLSRHLDDLRFVYVSFQTPKHANGITIVRRASGYDEAKTGYPAWVGHFCFGNVEQDFLPMKK